MDERAHDQGRGPPDTEIAAEPMAQAPEAVPEPPPGGPTEAPSQPPAAMAFVQLPRAAGGGAGAVSAPIGLPGGQRLADPPTELAPPAAPLLPEPPTPDSHAEAMPPPVEPVEVPAALRQAIEIASPESPLPPEPSPVVAPEAEPNPPPVQPSRELVVSDEPLAEPTIALAPAPLPSDPVGDAPPVIPTVEPIRARGLVEAPILPTRPPVFVPRQPATTRQAPAELARPPIGRKVGARWYLRVAFRFAAVLLLALAGLVLVLIVLYRWIDPPASALMLGQRLSGTPIQQRWVPIERMSPYLHHAVIVSEDARFCRHGGVDWGELEQAMESARDGFPRGGSTISMQVVKNLFLWPSKSYVRKAIEIPLAYVIEAAWGKRRILEIYLNIAEWGPGVFGAEAASRYHFRKPAFLLSPREAALLAVALPNPFERQAGSPGPGTGRLADNLLLRMRTAQGNAGCVRAQRTGG